VLWDELGKVPTVDHQLAAGDVVVFYTDGITERQTADGSMFDLDRLSAVLAGSGAAPPDAIAAAIVAELDQFASGQEPDDDQTLLVVALD
jgi:sigma-B regulation protein RsbU (phosphoserine phosphatase)